MVQHHLLIDTSTKCCTRTCSFQQIRELLVITLTRQKYKQKLVYDWNKKDLGAQPRFHLSTACTSDVPKLISSAEQPSQQFCYILCMWIPHSFLCLCPQYQMNPNFSLSALYQACLHKLKKLSSAYSLFSGPFSEGRCSLSSSQPTIIFFLKSIFTQSERIVFCSFLFDVFSVRQDLMRLKAQKTPCCVPCIKCTFS